MAWTCWPRATPSCGRPRAAARDQGPYFFDVDTYRYFGHSLSDPRNEYRTRDEEAAWKAVDPIAHF